METIIRMFKGKIFAKDKPDITWIMIILNVPLSATLLFGFLSFGNSTETTTEFGIAMYKYMDNASPIPEILTVLMSLITITIFFIILRAIKENSQDNVDS